MLELFKRTLDQADIDAIEQSVTALADSNGDAKAILSAIKPLRRAAKSQRPAADALLSLTGRRALPRETAVETAMLIRRTYPDDIELLSRIGEASEGLVDLDFLNAAPPEDGFLVSIADDLAAAAENARGSDEEQSILAGLSTAARMLGRQRDDIALAALERLVKLNPKSSANHYNLGLFCKTRGLFEQGVRANQSARALSGQEVEGYEWNLGICATGAGQGDIALDVWKRMGHKIESGRFDLPEGGYPECKVRLAERPLAERDAEHDDPGQEETIWIERLSPCHGIVRSVLYADIGVDFGDIVLIDGAPITYHKYGDAEVPVFPHLATLQRSGYRFYNFAGTQEKPTQVEDASTDLERDAVIYSHTERFQVMCSSCWNDPDVDHEKHDNVEALVVTGRIAAPPDLEPAALLAQIDDAMAKRPPCRVFSPELCRAAGLNDRARIEQRRFDMLKT